MLQRRVEDSIPAACGAPAAGKAPGAPHKQGSDDSFDVVVTHDDEVGGDDTLSQCVPCYG